MTKLNSQHIKTILQMLGLENAKPSPVPGRKLELQKDKPLSQDEKRHMRVVLEVQYTCLRVET